MTRATSIVLLLLALFSLAVADEEAAEFFAERGRKALAEKRWGEAEKQFRKALSEHTNYLPAVLGFAQAAIGQEKTENAIGFLESCLDIAERRTLDEAEKAIVAQAEALLKKLDRPRLDYRRIKAPYVAKLLSLAEKARKTDAELARRCVERILKLDPDHARARAILTEVGPRKGPAEDAASRANPDETQLFNGKDLSNWADTGPTWKVKDGMIIGTVPEHAYVIRTKEALEGNYRLEFEARIRKDLGIPRISFRFGVQDEDDCYAMNIYKGSFTMSVYTGDEDGKKLRGVDHYVVSDTYDRTEWNRYTILVKDDRATLSINGRKFFDHKADAGEYDGFVGLVVQECVAEFRKVAVIK